MDYENNTVDNIEYLVIAMADARQVVLMVSIRMLLEKMDRYIQLCFEGMGSTGFKSLCVSDACSAKCGFCDGGHRCRLYMRGDFYCDVSDRFICALNQNDYMRASVCYAEVDKKYRELETKLLNSVQK